MHSQPRVAGGAVLTLVAVPMLALFAQSTIELVGALAMLLAGVLFVASGVWESLRVAGWRVEDRHLLAGGSTLVALSMLPTVAESLVSPRETASLFWGVAMLVGILSLLFIAVMHATGRFEGDPSP